MPVYILVKAQDGWTQDDPMIYQTGYLVDARNVPRLGGMQVPPKCIQIEITDANDPNAIMESYCRIWHRRIGYENVSSTDPVRPDFAQDLHRLRVFVSPELVSASGLNQLTREQVETFLNRWNASLVSTQQNEVVFDARVYNAICSQGFWEKDVSLIVFSELSYNTGTGVHKIRANYSNDPVLSALPLLRIEAYIISKGATVTKNIVGRVEFTIPRGTVFDVFKAEVKERVDGDYARRIFKIPQQYVQMALDNAGTLSCTMQQFATYVYSRLND